MSDCDDQLRAVCQWNRELSCENAYLRNQITRLIRENRELANANAELRVERDSTDILLGEAMDLRLGEGELA